MSASSTAAAKWTAPTAFLLLVAVVAGLLAAAAPAAAGAADASVTGELTTTGGVTAAAPAFVPLVGALAPGTSSLAGVATALGSEPTVDPSGPVVTVGALGLTTAKSTTARFKVSWSAVPVLPAGGYDAYRVEYREPGVDYWLVWQAATTATSAVFPGTPGHVYHIRAAAARTTDAATVGPWSAERVATVPADDASFAYLKTWTKVTASTAYFGKVRNSTVKGATATYKFKGTKGALIAPRGPGLGKVAVYARRLTPTGWTTYSLVKTVDLYARTSKQRVATTFGSWDPTVQRQVKFVVTGKKNVASSSIRVRLDGFAAYGAPRTTDWHAVDIQPATPSVVVTDQLQFTASIADCVDQRVLWEVTRYDRFGVAYSDGAGTITADGLYTAPALPTCTEGEDQRTYYVIARAVANPDEVVGMRQITVTLGPPPVIVSISPSSGSPGSTVTFSGSHFASYGAVPQVYFSTREAEVTSYSDTTVTARVPEDWNTWYPSLTVSAAIVAAGQWSTATSSQFFTVTDILPAPPSPWTNGINAASLDDDNASVGDVVRIIGNGFASTASDNLVRFAPDVVVAAESYEPDAYSDILGTITVTVPEGAQTGALGFQRLDGDGRWNLDGPALEVKPATQPTLALHPSFSGYVTGPYMARNGAWAGGPEEWLLSGASLTKLRIATYSTTTAGVFWLDIRRDGVTKSRIMRAVSDTVAVPHRWWGEQLMMPDELFADAQPGDTVEIRIRGDELTNYYERSSPWVSVTVGDRPVYGGVRALPVDQVASWWGPTYRIARGDWLRLYRSGGPATQYVSCPGLWAGELPLGEDGILTKIVHLVADGTYTVTNHTTGESATFSVGDVGDVDAATYNGGWEALHDEGLLMRFGGGEIDIPPGAFPVVDPSLMPSQVGVYRDGGPTTPWDPTLTDGGRRYTLSILPYVTRLLKPITITVPYETEGRATVPFLGMWDDASRLYYDFGLSTVQTDTVNHRLTYVIPAGDYPHPADFYDGAVQQVDAPAALRATPLVGQPFNESFRQVGAVSSTVATSGEDLVWHPDGQPTWGVKVDAVTDPTSSSYVPPEKAQEVLDVAAATWENLAGKGWSQPEALITITVRDYGDPGVYQGATTKAVFGQPWVYVNSRLTMGVKLDTAVAHEMGHVFQRQLTTNVSTYWIDEAVAEWVAWDTLGAGGCDLQATFEAGCDFPAAAFPTGFWSGYTTEQAYGAGAFIIWLADTYGPAAVLDIYDILAYRPSYWYDAHGTFEEATGKTVPQLVAEFAPEFWLQTYEPISAYTFWSRLRGPISAFTGTTVDLYMGADSSRGASAAPLPAFAASLLDQAMVARAHGLPDGATIDVYHDTAASGATPATPVKIGTLSSLTPVIDLGVFDDTVGCYRLIAVTPAGAGLTTQVTIEAVHLDSVSPQNGAKAGGYDVTLSGCGFGDDSGMVTVGPAVVSGTGIVSWSDTRVVFRMPNMGTETGPQAVQVVPDIGGASNTVSFTTF